LAVPAVQAAPAVQSVPALQSVPAIQAAPAVQSVPAIQPAPALAETEAEAPITDGTDSEPVKPLRPVPGGKSGSKREIPSYLRVVK
jgi:hypothetical protein